MEKLVARMDLEQLAASVHTRQAPLLTQEQCWRLLAVVDTRKAKAKAEFDPLEAMLAARDKLVLVLMWLTGLRPSDTTRLLSQNISVAGDMLEVHVGVTKTGKKRHAARLLKLEATGEPDDPCKAWCAYLAEVARFGLRVEPGFLFREPKLRKSDRSRSWGANTTWANVDTRLSKYLLEAGLPADTKPHSMHGSHAKYDYEEGVPMQQTLQEMDWSKKSYQHYLKGRVTAPTKGTVL